ncbi:MAG: GNAT family N-acetyltransferase [Pirellulaceae bacterium]|nr:GNAT family N-acetyltransferase [Planctomycetales bacterium]
MSAVEIVPVKTRADRKRFLLLPWKLYAGDPNWIPPLRMNQEELLGFRKHPFYENAEAQAFLAVSGKEVVGRIHAIIDHGHNSYYSEKRGFFGFFESTNSDEVAGALFDAAKAWLVERGMTVLRGPVNPSMNYECGLLIDGFDSPPTFMMTYNPPYYADLIERQGLVKSQDLLAFWGHVEMLKELDAKLKFVSGEATRRFGVTVRRANTKNLKQEVRNFLDIYNKSLPGQWGFVPMSPAEVDQAAAGMKHMIVPEMTSVCEKDGQPVGVVFGLLDYNPRIKAADGRLFPFGFLKLLWNRRAIKKIRLISTNVLPQYQGWGLGLVLLDRLVTDVLEWGIQEVEFSWVLETNKLSRGSLERGGAKRIKTYRMYDQDLSAQG